MFYLVSTSDLMQIVTGSPVDIQVHASWLDYTGGNVVLGNTNTNIPTAATTTIVPPPASGTQRNIKGLEIFNATTNLSNEIKVQLTNGSGTVTLYSVNLNPQQSLQYTDDGGFNVSGEAFSLSFANISTGTNTTATMTLGPGSSLEGIVDCGTWE